MSRRFVNLVILFIVVALTIISLAISVQGVQLEAIATRFPELVIFALLMAFALILSVPLSRSELSIAHAIGLMALLSLPASVAPTMTIALFLGGTLGGVVRSRLEQDDNRYESPPWYATTMHTSARVTVAHFVASVLYINILNGTLPISTNLDMRSVIVPLTITIAVYLLLYLLSFMLQVRVYTRVRREIADNWIPLSIILILPMPFAVLGASVAQTDVSTVAFGITMVGAVLIIFGLFALNQSQQRLQRQLDEMRSISVATQAMRGNLELDGLLRTTYVQVSQLLDTSNFTVALYDDIDMRMTFPLVLRDGEEATNTAQNRTPVDYPLIEYIVEQQEPLLIESNLTQFVRKLGIQAIDKPFTSWLGVPLITGDKAFGAFVVQATDTRRFDADDLRLMNIIVASTSIAIENARLYSQKSVRAEQLATLNQITSLLTGTLAPTEVLDIVVSSASTISEADAVSVYLIDDEQSSSLSLARNAGLSDAFLAKPATPLLKHKLTAPTISEYVTPDSLLIENLDSVEAVALRQTLEREHKQAFLEHPLIFAGRNLGLLVLYYNKPQRYHPEQVNMIQAFATQASQAINNAQRFDIADKELEQRVEQLYALSSMGRVINATIEPQRLFEIVLSYATDATKAPRGFIALYRRTGRLYVPASRGYPYTLFEDADFLLQGLSGQVLTSGQMKRIEDTRQETAYLPLDPHTRSLLAIPIMKGREILGLIMLESDLAGSFSESDGHFVGQIINQAVIALDNTQLFQRVRQARDNMKVVLDAMQEGIILIDNEGFVVQTNPHISMIELHPDAILNQSIDDLLAEPSLEFAKRLGFTTAQTVKQLIERDNTDWTVYPPHDFEIHGDEFGVRYMQRQIIPIRDEDRYVTGIMLVFYNKSEERELAIARESLSQMIVHDLRSPLTSVTTSLGLLQRLIPKEAEFAEVVAQTTSMSRSAIRKVLSRVDSLLDIAKMESGDIRLDREPSHLRHIVDNVIVGLEPLARDHAVTLQTEFDPKVPLVEIDADKIERAILNLVDNAIKYSPPDSSVKVRVSLADQNYVHIDVVDSGPGIPDEYKKKLFERYVQIEGRKTVRRGVGLGLTFCKLVAEAHQGDIWVVDNPSGQGSTFKIKLPTVAKKEGLELS